MNTNTGLSGSCEGVLADRIYKYLVGRRYLNIIDDIWDIKEWDGIKRIFPDKSNASRIIITTRLSDVANYIARCAFVHQMQFLNEDQSWNLLQQKVFAQEHCPEELEVIGKLIAKNCRGLPLAIVGIAGVLLNVNKARNDWVEIARNVSSAAIHKNDEHVSKILSLSYNHLPHHLKPCFLYLGGFLGHKTIEVSKLIRLWVAEGFLKPTESKSMEEVGEEYFKDLVNRNLVLVTKKTSNGKFRYCSTHDVMRDLCSQIAHCENLLLCVQERHDFHPKPIGNARRLFFPTPAAYFSFRKYITEHASHVRSVIINANYQDDDQCLLVASGCKLLRILDGTTISHPSIPNAIFELLHIRYLALKVSGDIHPFIFRLSNLQTLILNRVISLPPAIWKMPQLRHVIAREASLSLFPYVCRFVSSLQTSKRIGNFQFTSDSIKMIPNLKTLKVVYRDDERYKYWEEFGLNNLFHLHQLEKLGICFDDQQRRIATPLPENFVFPSTLIKLTLSAVELPWEDMAIVGSLPNLQVLKLRSGAFVGDEWNTIEGEFPKLKFLLLQGLDLKFWGAENTHFPRLEQLHIRYCKKLEEIPQGIGDIPTLQLIRSIWSTPGADSSALRIQEEQRDQGNDDLQVHVISGIDRLR